MLRATNIRLVEPSVTLTGVISHIIHTTRDNRGVSAIFQLKTKGQKVVAVVEFGIISSIPMIGEIWSLTGEHKSDQTYGSQFKAENAIKLQADGNTPLEVLTNFLIYNSSFIGINSLWAKKLARVFGSDLFIVLSKSSVHELLENKKLKMSKVMASNLLDAWENLASQNKLNEFFKNKKLPLELIEATRQLLGDNAAGCLKENPYLIYPIISVKAPNKMWKELDIIIRKQFNIKKNDFRRAISYIESILYSAYSQHGHMSLPISTVKESLAKASIEFDLNHLVNSSNKQKTLCLNVESKTVQIFGHQIVEKIINSSLSKRITDAEFNIEKVPIDVEPTLSKLRDQGIEFNYEQRCAFDSIFCNIITVIDGCTNTGKSLIIRAVIDVFIQNNKNAWLISPSSCDEDKMLLGVATEQVHHFISKSKSRNRRGALANSLVVVDEAQIVDVMSLYKLLKCIPLNSRLCFVGDHRKLPPLGPGNMFQQLISTGSKLITELKKSYDGAHDNSLTNFKQILSKSGRRFDISSIPDEDFIKPESISMYQTVETSHESLSNITSNLWLELSKDFTKTYQVICANALLADSISKQIQLLRHYRKKTPCLSVGDSVFYEGEPVVFKKKSTYLEIASGAFAIIHKVFDEPLIILGRECLLSISINGKIIEMSEEDVECLSINYAITASKIQGRKFKNTIVLLDNSYLINKAWLYTATTASGESMILVGNRDNLEKTVCSTDFSEKRHFGIPLTLAI